MSAAMHLPMFYLRQKFAMTTNRYELDRGQRRRKLRAV